MKNLGYIGNKERGITEFDRDEYLAEIKKAVEDVKKMAAELTLNKDDISDLGDGDVAWIHSRAISFHEMTEFFQKHVDGRADHFRKHLSHEQGLQMDKDGNVFDKDGKPFN